MDLMRFDTNENYYYQVEETHEDIGICIKSGIEAPAISKLKKNLLYSQSQ